nr:MAG TPA: hypothetical protein [Caudoviricetes sp.]DAN21783.1 MAG TPA_asm: hypothetical protein [Bacteriophage sp.]
MIIFATSHLQHMKANLRTVALPPVIRVRSLCVKSR